MVLTTQSLAKFGLTALSAFILTACGSSGSGNNSSTPAENPASQVQQPAKPQKSDQSAQIVKPEQPQVNTNGTGAYSFIKEIEGNVSGFEKNIPVYPLTSFNKNTIEIDGIKIEIPSDEYRNNTWASFSSISSKQGDTKDKGREVDVCCERYSDVRFGIISSVDKDIPTYMFYNGNPTQVMPTRSATYSGNAIFMGDFDGKDDNKKEYPKGTSEFTINFGEKKLSGSLTTEDKKVININADIINNAFVGSATSDHFKADAKVEVQGKFFGKNAKELGGIAESHDDSFSAAFGAQKQ